MKKKILIVDDEMNMRFFLTTLVKTNGFEPIVANNGKEGIRKARENPPDLFILDVMMPEQGGAIMYRELKQDQILANIPVIILSGVGRETFYHYLNMLNSQTRIMVPNPDEYVEKPPEAEHLLALMKRYV